MSAEVASPLIGAAVGFVAGGLFPWLLQRSRYRREDLDGVRERLGIARALETEIRRTRYVLKTVLESGRLHAYFRLRLPAWESLGHRLTPALKSEPLRRFTLLYARLSYFDDVLAASASLSKGFDIDEEIEVPEGSGEARATEVEGEPTPGGKRTIRATLELLVADVDAVLSVLTSLDAEYVQKHRRLSRTWREGLRDWLPGESTAD